VRVRPQNRTREMEQVTQFYEQPSETLRIDGRRVEKAT